MSKPYTPDTQYQYDLFVVGAGSGGVRASRIAATHGARVAVAENKAFGGTCVNVGCIPKKLFVYAAHYGHDFEDAKNYGWTSERTFDWNTLVENKNKEISRLNGIYEGIFKNNSVSIHRGFAKLVDRNTIEIDGQTVTSKYVLLAPGSMPYVPDFPGKEHAVTSDDMFYLKEKPKRILIVGGGYIAVEFACIMHGLGSHVTQVYRGPLFLRHFDHDARAFLADQMKTQGIDLKFNQDVTSIVKKDDGTLVVELKDAQTVECDVVLYATGRVPRTEGLGLENAGIELDGKGAIRVDHHQRTNVDNIFAVGDVTGRVQLTPVAIREGHCFADTIFGNKPRQVDYRAIPTAVFSTPTLGSVGLIEEDACKEFGKENVIVYRTSFRPLKHAVSGRAQKAFMKLIVEKHSNKVVGAHVLSDDAGELIQVLGVCVKAGLTKAQFDDTIAVHPTASEELVLMPNPSPSTLV